MPLTAKQARFVAEYLIDLNGKQAAIRAGYKPSNAESTASTLLADPKVSKVVKTKQAEQLASADLTAAKVKERIGLLAFQDVREFFDAAGNLKPIKDLSDAAAARVASFEVIKKNAEAGDGIIDVVHKLKSVDAIKPLEMLAKHFGLLVERLDHSGSIVFRHERVD